MGRSLMTTRYSVGMLGLYTEDIDRLVEAEELFADLIERAYLAAQIDGATQTLAYLRLANNYQSDEH